MYKVTGFTLTVLSFLVHVFRQSCVVTHTVMYPGDGQALTGTGYRHTPLSRRPARAQSMMKFRTRANEQLATDQDPCGTESAEAGE